MRSSLHDFGAMLGRPLSGDPSWAETATAVIQALDRLADRFNLFSALSSLPAGIPSLMAGRIPLLPFGIPGLMSGRMPLSNPVGEPGSYEIVSPLHVLAIWIAIWLVGLGMGAFFFRGLVQQVAPKAELASGWIVWGRLILLAALVYCASIALGVVVILVAALLGVVLPLLGAVATYFGFFVLFWFSVYVSYAPFSIVRYGFGAVRAILESVAVVSWNLLGTVGYLIVAFALLWLSNMVWSLPDEVSWFALLGLLGHAFVSTTLLVGSFAFYQGRKEWMTEQLRLRKAGAQGVSNGQTRSE